MPRQYNNPGTTESSIGSQIRTDHYDRKALIERQRERFFAPTANSVDLPKHTGKEIVKYHYVPLLDDANVNDEGIDASGTASLNGNLYGSSKDIGTITGKLPVLTENGGMVNRVGFTRKEIRSDLRKFGFYSDYTKESMDFDSDKELEMHIRREAMNGAVEIDEDLTQIDLLTCGSVTRFAGVASSDDTMTGESGATVSEVDYDDFVRLNITLDNNRDPKMIKYNTGTNAEDTRTIRNARIMYIGSELVPTIERMKDYHNNPAFISIEKYAGNIKTLNGEIGSIANFRIVLVPEMLNWSGVGATVATNGGYRATGGKYDVFPMLVVGAESYAVVGFNGSKGNRKFTIKHAKPESPESYANDRYGETGFSSLKWYYGFVCYRPERIAVIKSVARL